MFYQYHWLAITPPAVCKVGDRPLVLHTFPAKPVPQCSPYIFPSRLHFMFYQDYCHGIVCQGEDVGGANGIVTSGDGGGTAVCRDIDRLAIPPYCASSDLCW